MIFLYKNSSNTNDYLAWLPVIGVRIKTKKFIKLRKLKILIKKIKLKNRIIQLKNKKKSNTVWFWF
jgi:hypothetical protein